jgi:RimJ/RimL family protein N-acetyltransferase
LTAPADLPILRSARLLLRQPGPADVPARVGVPRDPEELRMYGRSDQPRTFTAAEIASDFVDLYHHQDLTTTRRFIIAALVWPDGSPADEPGGRFVGHPRLQRIDWQDRNATLAIGIFDRRFWSHGYGSEAIRLLLGYAFDALDLHRVGLRVLEYNTRAIRAYEKCGFVREGIERETKYVDGRWYGDIMMSILASDFRLASGQQQEQRDP